MYVFTVKKLPVVQPGMVIAPSASDLASSKS